MVRIQGEKILFWVKKFKFCFLCSFKSIMELQFEKVLVNFEYRPRSSSYKTTLALGGIYLKDRLTKETVFPVSVTVSGSGKFF